MKFIDQEKYKNLIGVYKITCLLNGKIYIGSVAGGVGERNFRIRHFEHLDGLEIKSHNRHLQNAYNKYGTDNFIFEVLEICEKDEDCIPREQFYLDTLLFAQEYIRKEDNRFIELGYCIRTKAESNLGTRRTEEQKQKQSIRMKKSYEEHPEKNFYKV